MLNNKFIFTLQRFATITNETSKTLVSGTSEDDSIDNSGNYVTIDGDAGDDKILNGWLGYGNNSSIDGDNGNDSIFTAGDNVTISGGNDDDVIANEGRNVSISGNAGNDSIENYGSNVTIVGGDGLDTIAIDESSEVSIDGGTGNDLISLSSSASNNIIQYSEGDGNDLILGFNETSTLLISSDSYSTEKSGSDIIVTVGDGKITLGNAASLSAINIFGTSSNSKFITLTEGNDTYNNTVEGATIKALDGNDSILSYDADSFSISGGAGNDSISSYYGSKLTINGGSGNDLIRLSSSASNNIIQYSEGDGNDLILGFNETSILQIGDGNDTFSTISSGNDMIVTVGEGKITLVGAATLSTVNIYGIEKYDSNVVTLTEGNDTYKNINSGLRINALAGNDSISNTYYEEQYIDDEEYHHHYYYVGRKVSINGGSGNDSIQNIFSNSTLEGGAGNDYILNTYYEYTNSEYNDDEDELLNHYYHGYYSGSGVSINGGSGNDSIHNDSDKVTIDGGAGDDFISNQSYDYNNNYDDDEDYWDEEDETVYEDEGNYLGGKNVTINGGEGNDTIENSGTNYVLFKYTSGDGNDSIVGFNTNSTLQIGDGTDTFSSIASGKNIIVTVGDGKITLVDATSLSKVNIEGIDKTVETYSWTLSGTTAKYGTSSKTLVTVKGVKSLDGISLDGTTVTVSKASLNAKKVTISDGYTLKLDSDVTKPSTTKAAWSLKSSIATYKSSSKTAGYTLASDGKSITYSKATTAETLVTVKGVKSIKGLKLSGTTVTVAKSSLNAEKVTISDGYSLKLADDVTKPTTKKAWSLKSSTATYKQTTTAGYSLANNEINYTKKATTTLATVKGVKSLDGLKVSGTTITVSKASLNAKNVTVSDGYSLKLGSDVTKPTVKNAAWSLKSTTATYKGTSTAGYTLASDAKSITYSKKATTTLATVKGVKSTSGLKVNDKIITVSKASLGTSKITLSGDGYTLKLGSDVSKSTTKNAWGYSSSTATYKQTTSAGYSLATNSKSISYVKTSSTNTLATVKGAKSKSGLSVSDHVITLKNSALSNKVTVSGSYEFDFASDYKKATITGSSKADTITARGSNIKINGGAGADSLSGGSSNDSINGGTGNDLIYGNKGADTLLGGSGNDSLWGGAGNDSLYGGTGNDTFIYKPGEGTDTIFNFQTGDLLTILKSNGKEGGSFTSSSFKNGNLTLGISGGGSVIFDGVSKNGTFNINGDSYKISGSKLVQK